MLLTNWRVLIAEVVRDRHRISVGRCRDSRIDCRSEDEWPCDALAEIDRRGDGDTVLKRCPRRVQICPD